jgi:hypothetical protein
MPEIKKTPAGRGEVTAFKGEFGNFSIFRFLLGAKSDAGRTRYQRLMDDLAEPRTILAALTSFCSPSAIDRSYPSNDLPKVVIGFDDVSEVRHRPDYSFGTPSSVAQLPKRIAWTQFTCAKGDQPEQRVVVVTVDPNRISQRCGHTATATSTMTAVATSSHILAMAFLGHVGEIWVRAFQLAFRRACDPLQRRHDLRRHGGIAPSQSRK